MYVCVCVCVCVRARAHARTHSVVSNSSVTPWGLARQAPVSMGLFRQEYFPGGAVVKNPPANARVCSS